MAMQGQSKGTLFAVALAVGVSPILLLLDYFGRSELIYPVMAAVGHLR